MSVIHEGTVMTDSLGNHEVGEEESKNAASSPCDWLTMKESVCVKHNRERGSIHLTNVEDV